MWIGTFLGISDEFFVLTTSRQIAESFNKGSSSSWLFVGYNLGYSMALPIYGRVYEVLGQRKTFLIAYALYTVGCIVSYGIEPF
jgi:MFS family permease